MRPIASCCSNAPMLPGGYSSFFLAVLAPPLLFDSLSLRRQATAQPCEEESSARAKSVPFGFIRKLWVFLFPR